MKKISKPLLVISLSLFLFSAIGITKEQEKDTKQVKKATVQKSDTVKPESDQKKNDSVKDETAKATVTTPIKENKVLSKEEIIQKAGNPQTSSSAAGEQIDWQVISSGGNRGTSTNFILSGTIGQTAVGLGSSTNYMLNSGFWQNFSAASGCCIGIRGNVDNDGSDAIDIADLVYFVAYSFSGGPAPVCFEEADMDASLGLDIGDIVYLVAYSFGGGPAPLPC